ncbi:N-acetylglucosamine kinase [Arthrobacter sp. MDT1-65]
MSGQRHGSSGGPVVLAIDGGGSKTDIVAVTLEGRVLFRSRGGGSNPQILGLDRSLATVRGLAADALAAVDGRPLLQTSLYLSGMDLPAEIEDFTSAISGEAWATGVDGRQPVVENDLLALLRAGTDHPDAVAVVCGTGINAIGVRADGRTARFPALGMISGDWGGGGHLGAWALWHAARSEDGRGEKTLLQDLIPRSYDVATVMDVIEDLHFERVPARSVIDLAPVLFEASALGDPVATSVVDRQAEEIVVMAVTALRRLDLLEAAVPVVLGGSVLAADHSRLMSRIGTMLKEAAPDAWTRLVTAPPILGAALLALETAGADDAALELARVEIESPVPEPGRGRPTPGRSAAAEGLRTGG